MGNRDRQEISDVAQTHRQCCRHAGVIAQQDEAPQREQRERAAPGEEVEGGEGGHMGGANEGKGDGLAILRVSRLTSMARLAVFMLLSPA